MQRRNFLKSLLLSLAAPSAAMAAGEGENAPTDGASDRAYWTQLLDRIAEPVLSNMAKGRLKKTMAVEVGPTWDHRHRDVAYLEAFGRLMAGLAPWLTLPDDETAEGKMRRRLRAWALESFAHSVDPKSPDYLLWRQEGQPLVDSAYYSNALMRAPKQLWEPLDAKTKTRIVTEMKGLRRVSASYNNWLLFAAMNEAFLMSVGEEYDLLRINVAVRKINEWYAGDGWYNDGVQFHFDYYNSYVIQPMLVEILETVVKAGVPLSQGDKTSVQALRDQALLRMQRFGDHLERLIGPDGAYPPIGRSLTYRSAAFQPLSLMAWRKQLPEKLSEGQIRAALTAVHRRIFANPTNFNAEGFLTLGFAGHQPEISDSYSNNGSMYVVSESFLALGLPADDSFWTVPPASWTAKKAFANERFAKDYAVSY